VLVELAREVGATRVATTRRYEPHAASVETEVSARLRATGVAFARYEGNLLAPPEALRTGAGRPFQVYTPFARAFRMQEQPARPLPTPERLIAPARWPPGIELDRLLPPPRPDWAGGLRSTWRPGEAGGRARLEHFVAAGLGDYAHARDLPGVDGVSMLSPFLHFGELSIRRAWHAAGDALRRGDDRFAQNAEKFRAELLWREFGHHVLVHWPHTDLAPLRSEFARFPWRSDPAGLRAWRLSDRRRRHAPALVHRLDAQSGANVRGQFSGEASPPAMARGSPLVLGHVGRCGLGQQLARLAMERRLWS
jgi:deoxyribodipyrimidine photo-lyase